MSAHQCYACGQTLPQKAYNLPSSATWETDLLAHLEADLGRESDGFRALWTLVREPRIRTVKQWATALGLSYKELGNRWPRAALPTPRRYIVAVQLIRVAALWEHDALSNANVALLTGWSEPHNLSRFVRKELGFALSDARVRITAAELVQRFRENLVLPHLDTLRHKPLLAPNLCAERRRRARAKVAQERSVSEVAA